MVYKNKMATSSISTTEYNMIYQKRQEEAAGEGDVARHGHFEFEFFTGKDIHSSCHLLGTARVWKTSPMRKRSGAGEHEQESESKSVWEHLTSHPALECREAFYIWQLFHLFPCMTLHEHVCPCSYVYLMDAVHVKALKYPLIWWYQVTSLLPFELHRTLTYIRT